jgi:lon-related putative ATP-dependent protease
MATTHSAVQEQTRVETNRLYRLCDPAQFDFQTTADLEELPAIIGQPRAVDAVRFGMGIKHEGYNLFVLGRNGIGKHTSVSEFLERKTLDEPVPPDWCYVNNFELPHQPKALQMPSGRAVVLAQDVKRLVEELQAVIPATFESDEYQARQRAVEEEFKQRQEGAFKQLQRSARERGIAVIRAADGLAFAPLRDGEVVSPEQFMELPPEERQRVESEITGLQSELQAIVRQAATWMRETRNRLKSLNEEVTLLAVKPLIDELKQKYAELEQVQEHLAAMQHDIVENVERFLQPDGDARADVATGVTQTRTAREAFFGRYFVNVLVDHSREEGAPVVYEDNPTYQNLIGRAEHVAQMGTLLTDFNLIKAGALHQANGGYLILDVRKLLMQAYAWEGLKRALRARQICIESLGQIHSLISTVSLDPEPIPLDVKVVLLGERFLYYLLYYNDPDFSELFKVAADFEDEMDRTAENNALYARMISTVAHKEKMRPFEPAAVARVIEHSSRLVSDAEKLATHMQSIADLLRESDYWAGENGRDVVSRSDVQQAIDAHIYRAGRLRDRMQEAILRETVHIDSDGAAVGQINGLSVISVGDFSFGRPSRITARVRLGKGEVIDIERQVEMGGPIHSKGVLILANFLGARYAAERPLSVSASLVFEQSYAGVEGDSASTAELYALLSALSGVPIKQSLAVTGSVNQHGRVQAIGGANEKIEGFFDLCQARGLTGEQGVLIPQSNVQNLMLRQDVVEAVADGRFHIYAVSDVDEGIELLTGLAAGQPDGEGHYPEGSVNGLVEKRLEELAEKQRKFGRPPQSEESEQPTANSQQLTVNS